MKKIRIHREGYGILLTIAVILIVANMLVWYSDASEVIKIVHLSFTILVYGFIVFFFRSPSRVVEIDDDNMIIAPADGRICVIEPTEVQEYFCGERMLQVSIFMSLVSVHANWFPVSGKVLYVKHHEGRHIGAYLPKSSMENERAVTVIESKNGLKIMAQQVAGALARRIVTYASAGTDCSINEHLGFIKFGSRVDLFLPLDSQLFVELGEHTRGNETIIARLPKGEG